MKKRFEYNGFELEARGRVCDGKRCVGCVGDTSSDAGGPPIVRCDRLPKCGAGHNDGKEYIWTEVRLIGRAEK